MSNHGINTHKSWKVFTKIIMFVYVVRSGCDLQHG